MVAHCLKVRIKFTLLGNEGAYFGQAIKAALIKFQEANREGILTPAGLTKGTGVMEPGTRRVVGK